VLAEIVVDDQRVATSVHPSLGQCTAGERREVLHAGQRARLGDDHRGVVHRLGFGQQADRFGDFAPALTDQHQDTAYTLVTLMDHCVERERALAGALVADQQLALAAPDRQQRVDDRVARVQRPRDGIAFNDRRRARLERALLGDGGRRKPVERPAERVDHAPEQRIAATERQALAAAPKTQAGNEFIGAIEEDATRQLLVELEHPGAAAVMRMQHFTNRHRRQPLHPGDAVGHTDDGADFLDHQTDFRHCALDQGADVAKASTPRLRLASS
jgi:hypothetical protein